jgi:hypothetical protein
MSTAMRNAHLKGRLKVFFGSISIEEGIVEEGDFVFIPKGTLHGLMNDSATAAEIISCYGELGNMKELGTFYFEPPGKVDDGLSDSTPSLLIKANSISAGSSPMTPSEEVNAQESQNYHSR